MLLKIGPFALVDLRKHHVMKTQRFAAHGQVIVAPGQTLKFIVGGGGGAGSARGRGGAGGCDSQS